MASFDYDVVIIGSGFGGSVAALRAAEKGYRVGVMEAGRRWKDEDIPKTKWDQPRYAVAARSRDVWDTEDRVPRRRTRPLRRRRGRRLACLRQHLVCPSEAVLRRRRNGRASPTGPTNWRRVSTRHAGCSASFATRTCLPTSIGTCSRSRSRWEEGKRSTRPRWVSTSAARASRLKIRTSAVLGRAAPAASHAATA